MRAVVLGGGGLTGRCTVRDLAQGRVFDEIVAADLDAGLAAQAARAAGPQCLARTVDVRNSESLASVLAGAAVCVNAVQYTFNLEVMAGCLLAGVPYLDFGGLFHMTRRQLEWNARFRAAGLVAIPGLGEVPGVSNVLAWEATRDMENVESVLIRDGWKDLTPNGPELLFTWSPSTFLDEMVLDAMVWENGVYHPYPAMSGPEEFDFPEPVGRTRVYRTLHSEPATLPESLSDRGLHHCEWKEGGPGIDALRTLALLGLASEQAVDVDGHAVIPRRFLLDLLKSRNPLGAPTNTRILDWELLDIEITGTAGGRPIRRHAQARFPPKPEWNLTVTEYAVGVAGAIGAEMIARGEISEKGVLPPERCVPAVPFREALRARGIETTITPPEAPLGRWKDPWGER
jgi:lysine 6-dehydrogenase